MRNSDVSLLQRSISRLKALISAVLIFIVIMPRKFKYRMLSNNKIRGKYTSYSPVLSLGDGNIQINGANLGVTQSPQFFNSYIYLDARSKNSLISIGQDVWINNNAFICADKSSIIIKEECLIGVNFSCIDSDFHTLDPNNRLSGEYQCKPVVIERNVFIGNNVSILKGVTIGENSVIANGAVVTKSFPNDVVIGGNPAKIIRKL